MSGPRSSRRRHQYALTREPRRSALACRRSRASRIAAAPRKARADEHAGTRCPAHGRQVGEEHARDRRLPSPAYGRGRGRGHRQRDRPSPTDVLRGSGWIRIARDASAILAERAAASPFRSRSARLAPPRSNLESSISHPEERSDHARDNGDSVADQTVRHDRAADFAPLRRGGAPPSATNMSECAVWPQSHTSCSGYLSPPSTTTTPI
jgi:hypothetical protein